MYQVKFLHANQVNMLEELINLWLQDNTDKNVVDIKFHSNNANGMPEYVAILVYQQ